MSIAPRPPVPELIPESAPFTPEQRTWLNGFFAGLLSLDGAGITPLSPAESAALMPALPAMRHCRTTATTARRPGTTRRCRSPNA